MEGKPLVINGEPLFSEIPPQWVVLQIHAASEIAPAIELLSSADAIAGMYLEAASGIALWELFQENFKFVQAAGGVVLDEKDRLLAIRRLGKWDLPKGKVEKGEDLESAALREVQEECGIKDLSLLSFHSDTWHTYQHKGKHCLKHTAWYLMRSSSRETLVPQHEEDIEEVRWVPREEADSIMADTYPSLLSILTAWKSGSIGAPR